MTSTTKTWLCEHPERKSLRGSGTTNPQESGCLLHSGDWIPWWQLPHSQGQGHQVQALLVRKRQMHCWYRSVCGGRVDRESFWGAESLRHNHLSETYSGPACGYLSVCVCLTEWSKWWVLWSAACCDCQEPSIRISEKLVPVCHILFDHALPCIQCLHGLHGRSSLHSWMGYGRPEPDVEGERIREYALAFDLLLGNTCFKKHDSHLITYKSGNIAMEMDFILFCRTMGKLVTNVKVIPGEEVALQHQLLVCNIRIDVPPKSKRKFIRRLEVWKLKDPQTSSYFQEVFNLHVSTSAGVADWATEDVWNNIKTGLLKTTEEVCCTTLPYHWRRESWWWNEQVEKAIVAKRKAFKTWKAGKGTRAS